jgi:acetoin utilization deacetylase AcuC-like enzyme
MKCFWSPEYVRSEIAFDTTRKSRHLVDSLDNQSGVQILPPKPATDEQLLLCHTSEYLQALKVGWPRSLARSAGLGWDRHRLTMARYHAGGVIDACRAALLENVAGSFSSGLHHARSEAGDGYCTLNGLAIAARQMQRAGAARRILIIDLDAHGGGGTYSLVHHVPGIVQLDVSVNAFDVVAHTTPHRNYVVTEAHAYLETCAEALAGFESEDFDLCLYNAGVDIHQDSMGGLCGVQAAAVEARDACVFDFASRKNLPIAFVLAGGYTTDTLTQDQLTRLHTLVVEQGLLAQGTYK